jgi:Fe-S cluster assembly ATP-binding protein
MSSLPAASSYPGPRPARPEPRGSEPAPASSWPSSIRIEIPGVANVQFLRAALNSLRRYRDGEAEMDAFEFLDHGEESSLEQLGIDESFLCSASLNEGLLRGRKETQRNPPDGRAGAAAWRSSTRPTPGLDIDALKTVVARGINATEGARTRGDSSGDPLPAPAGATSSPDQVHVLADGRIVRSGDARLALELEDKGYGWLTPETQQEIRP